MTATLILARPTDKKNSPEQQQLLDQADKDMVSAARALLLEVDRCLSVQKENMHARVARATTLIIGGALLALIAGLLVSLYLVRNLTGALNRVISSLENGSEQVAAASLQVSSASQSLAAGASQQAASLEETTSSLEELAASVKQNSTHAEECNQLVLQTHDKTKEVHKSIRATRDFMETIAGSGGKGKENHQKY